MTKPMSEGELKRIEGGTYFQPVMKLCAEIRRLQDELDDPFGVVRQRKRIETLEKSRTELYEERDKLRTERDELLGAHREIIKELPKAEEITCSHCVVTHIIATKTAAAVAKVKL